MSALTKVVNTIGLSLGVIGAWLIWRFGLPPDVDRQGRVFYIGEREDEDEIKKARKYDKRTSFGFGLLIAGFVLQAISNFIT